MKNKNENYHPFAKFLHWTIVVLLAFQFLSSWLMPSVRHNSAPNFFIDAHFSFGILVLPIAIMFLFMHFYRPVAKLETEISSVLVEMTTVATQGLLYALLFIIPFSGYVSASIRGVTVSFFHIFSLPVLTIQNPSILYSLGKMHSSLAMMLGIIAFVHISAALYHHFVLKDLVLQRMRPSRHI